MWYDVVWVYHGFTMGLAHIPPSSKPLEIYVSGKTAPDLLAGAASKCARSAWRPAIGRLVVLISGYFPICSMVLVYLCIFTRITG